MTLKIAPPEPPRAYSRPDELAAYTHRLYRWLYDVYRKLEGAGILDWDQIASEQGSIADLGVKDHNLLNARDVASVHPHSSLSGVQQADDTSTSVTGGKHVTDAQLKEYRDHQTRPNDVHGIGAASTVVGTSTAQTLRNKQIDGDENTLRDLANNCLKIVLASANRMLRRNSTGAVIDGNTVPDHNPLVTTHSTQTLFFKAMDGDLNTFTDIALTSLKTILADADKVIRRDANGAVISGNALPNDSEIVTLDAVQQVENKTTSDLQFDVTGPARTPAEGMVYWDVDAKTLAAKLDGSEAVLQIGQEVHIRVTNKTGSDIVNGQIVYVNGQEGNRPTVALAKADAAATAKFVGMATELIENNTNGYVTVFGLVRGLDTSAYSAGDKIYLSAATAGAFTKTAPSFPNFVAYVGRVIVSHATDGIVGVNPGVDYTNGVMVNSIGAATGKFGDIGNGHYSEFESDGTYKMNGNATVWDDSQVPATSFRNAAAAFTLDVLAGGIYQPRFDLNGEAHCTVQFPHSLKENTVIRPHIHLINKNAIGATNYNVAIEFEWGWVNRDAVLGSTTTTTTITVSFQNAAALTHKTSDALTLTPGTGQGGISSMLLFRIKRVAASSEPYNTNDIFTLGFDVHYEKDTIGSRGYDTK